MKIYKLLFMLFVMSALSANLSAQYSYGVVRVSLELTDGRLFTGYIDGGGHYCKGDTLCQQDILESSSLGFDTVRMYLGYYIYKAPESDSDTLFPRKDCGYYWNLSSFPEQDLKWIVCNGHNDESTLWPASYREINDEDTIWMNTTTVDKYRIGIFDSIVSDTYISGCNYSFYSHSNDDDEKLFMQKVRDLDMKLLSFALKEKSKYYSDDDEIENQNYGFELPDETMEAMFDRVENLLKEMGDLKIVVIPDCFD